MLTIGSRGSQLALWQARWVQARLEALGEPSRIEIIKTTGDKITDVPLSQVGAKGLFTKEIEEALIEGRIDLAVHSLKDLPTEMPSGLVLAAIPEREDPRDALIGCRLAELPQGAKVGTSSLRRAAQLHAARPDLRIESLRGNLDTRLRKLDQGQYEAIVLAAAGLRRLGWEARISELLDPELLCPAVGQGALAIETRDDGSRALEICRRLDHASTRAAVTAERALLAGLGGGCQVPIGCHATIEKGRMRVRAVVASPNGDRVVRLEKNGPAEEAASLGATLARELLAAGAREVLESVYGPSPLLGVRVVVTRPKEQAGDLAAKLRALGAEVAELPTIEIQPSGDYAPLDRAVAAIDAYDWIIFTSANGVRAFAARGGGKSRAKICAIGPGTRKAAEAMGLEVTLVPAEYVAESLVEAFAGQNLSGLRVLLPRAAVARDVVPTELAKLGAQVDVVEAYRTGIPSSTAARAQEIFERRPRPEWITFTSSSTVRNFVAAAGLEALAGARIASIGPVTSATARRLGIQIDVEATPYTTDALIDALVSATRAAAGR
jgi:hydroxymethylbilane synthase